LLTWLENSRVFPSWSREHHAEPDVPQHSGLLPACAGHPTLRLRLDRSPKAAHGLCTRATERAVATRIVAAD
jgi:hypothetical protein